MIQSYKYKQVKQLYDGKKIKQWDAIAGQARKKLRIIIKR
jgi:hypothetical protein